MLVSFECIWVVVVFVRREHFRLDSVSVQKASELNCQMYCIHLTMDAAGRKARYFRVYMCVLEMKVAYEIFRFFFLVLFFSVFLNIHILKLASYSFHIQGTFLKWSASLSARCDTHTHTPYRSLWMLRV